MLKTVLRTLAVAIPAVLVTTPAAGQLAVQQPAFGVTSAATTLSVPDGGGAFVGGFGQARSSRSVYDFGRRGPLTREAAASGLSVGVAVHDFAEMDAAVLAAARGAAPSPVFSKSRYDDPTSHAMARRFDAVRRIRDRVAAGELVTDREPAGPSVAELLERRDAAERRGEPGVAAIYARLAAKRAGTAPAVGRPVAAD